MTQTTERLGGDFDTPAVTAQSNPIGTHTPGGLWPRELGPRARTESHVSTRSVAVPRQIGHFVRHYLEMCAPMCVGFAVGDLVYFWAAGRFGYSEPFRQLPEASVLVVTFTMTAPMAAWMLFRGMPQRPTAEMSAAMPILAIVLLTLGWLGIVPRSGLALSEHGLMMPAMLVPMLFRLDLYTGRAGHAMHGRLRSRPERARR